MKAFFVSMGVLLGMGSYAQTPELVLPKGHTSWVEDARFSPDNKLIVTASMDRTAIIWDTASGSPLRTLDGLEGFGFVYSAEFSPDGKMIVTISDDKVSRIWDVVTGKLLQSFEGYDEINSARFSPNNKFLVTAGDSVAKVWSVNSGKLLYSLKSSNGKNRSAQFSPDGNQIVTCGEDEVKIWDLNSGREIYSLRIHSRRVYYDALSADGKYLFASIDNKTFKIWDLKSKKTVTLQKSDTTNIDWMQFSPDNARIVTCSDDKTAKIWDVHSGKPLFSLQGHTSKISTSQFSPDGNYVLTASDDNTAKVWDVKTGKLINDLASHSKEVTSAAFSADGKFIVTASNDKTAKIWDVGSSKMLHSLGGSVVGIFNSEFSPDGKSIVTAYKGINIKVWDVNSGQLIHVLKGHQNFVRSANFSPDGKFIFSASFDTTARLWNAGSGSGIRSLGWNTDYIQSIQFSHDSRFITTDYGDDAAIWNVNTGEVVTSLTGHKRHVFFSQFSPDDKYVVTASFDSTAKIWDVASGKMLKSLNGHQGRVYEARFSLDGKYVVTSSEDSTARIWEVHSGELIKTLKPNIGSLRSSRFSPDGKTVLMASWDDATAKILEVSSGKNLLEIPNIGYLADVNSSWTKLLSIRNSMSSLYDIQTGRKIISWASIGRKDWVAIHPSGLFDASPGAIEKLYFVQGLDMIDFNQLKARYYEPGLWKKVISGEKLRDAIGFKSIDLPPDIQVGKVNDKGFLPIELINRGGGIGEVTVSVFGKEITLDARERGADPDAASLKINYYIGNNKNLIVGDNLISVKAWNKDHWVESRGKLIEYTTTGKEAHQPTIHILTIGIADYTGTEIDLKYAAKDAEDVSKALQLGAKQLFGTERSYVYNLTTNQNSDHWPTKKNILAVFGKISMSAHPLDVVVVYLSGHGINIGGTDGDWHYLTQEAYSASAASYSDPAIVEQTTISSSVLVELFKKIPAAKQVLMIDACASGKVVENLMAQKDIPSSTLRALDRMKDRTGMHIITGCTADAVSYEASRYGQGVLTYSLLEGIRGAALREDQFVDIMKLFQYAQDRVPALASGIGGIQTPMVFSPNGSQSFDVGQLGENEKKSVPIAKIRPVYIRSNFQDENDLEDVLNLGKKVDDLLNESASKGTEAPLIFIDVREYPEGCKLVGRYRKENGKIVLKLKKRCEGKDATVDLSGIDINDLSSQIIKSLAN